MHIMKTLLIALSLAASTGASAVQQSSVAGKWKVESNVGGTASEQSCTFTQKEDGALSGTCDSDQGDLAITGKVDGKSVTWQLNTRWEGQVLTVIYSGSLESPAKIVGRVDVQPMGVTGDFTATQQK